ncbi:hypothetical protein D3C85_1744720 [compost metagenome]
MHRRLLQLVHQDLGQAFIRGELGNFYVTGGEVLEDRLEDVTDGERAGLLR